MVARIAAAFVTLVAAATAVSASVIPRTDAKCNTGPVQCCDTLQKSDSKEGALVLGLLGLATGPLDTFIGINCNPIPILGATTGTSCTQAPVCCENNSAGGLVNVGCVPIITPL
ncbi:fungal hydrophobin [Trametes cingulata]|nr:fungal hydrophobin [Trametes cingulata]